MPFLVLRYAFIFCYTFFAIPLLRNPPKAAATRHCANALGYGSIE